MSEELKVSVSDDIHALWCEYTACLNLREDLVNKKLIGYKLAKKAAVDAEKARLLFWKRIRECYPDKYNFIIEYLPYSQELLLKENIKEK